MQAMQVLSRSQEMTADNLANINTPGFKGNKVFYRMFQENVNGKEVSRSVPMQQVNLDQGILEPTGNQFDLGINGEGFFVVEEEGQKFLTRDGRFHLDPDGYLVNNAGGKVMGDSGPINLSEYMQAQGASGGAAMLEVSKDGTFRLNNKVQDMLKVVRVEDPAVLQRKGNAYFAVEDEDLMIEEDTGMIMQGYYEKGNVNPLTEMVDMMRNMQAFESQQRALKTTDEMLSQVTTQLGRF
jgi:flagellar basal-body rod protein FlgF/flagellar basal-body rod protein FlgG